MDYIDTLRTAYLNYQQAKKALYEAESALADLVIPSPPAIIETHEQVKEFQDTYDKAMQDQEALYDIRQDEEAAMIERLHELEKAIPITDTWFLIDDVFIRQTVRGGVDIVPLSEVLAWMTYPDIHHSITDEEVERRR